MALNSCNKNTRIKISFAPFNFPWINICKYLCKLFYMAEINSKASHAEFTNFIVVLFFHVDC